MSEVNQCFQPFMLIKILQKKNIFNTFLFDSKKEPQKFLKVNSFFKENTRAETKMLLAHNNTFTPPHMFLHCERKIDCPTAGHFKLANSINNKRNTMLYHATTIRTHYA